MIAQLICFILGLILFGFGLVIGLYPEGDHTIGILIMFGGLAQILYSFGVGDGT
jgi:flagellar basal body P-ring protein FlgI